MLTPRLPVSLDVPLASAVVVVVLRHDETLLRDVVRVVDTHAVPPSLEDARASVPGETIAHTTPSGSGATRSAGASSRSAGRPARPRDQAGAAAVRVVCVRIAAASGEITVRLIA